MMRYNSVRLAVVALSFLLLFWGGCLKRNPQKLTTFYLLNSLPEAEKEEHLAAAEPEVTVAVGAISFPEYLDLPQIATRTSLNELRRSEFHRWAEPLQSNFKRVLEQNLALLLSEDNITVIPWTVSIPINYQVGVEVRRFDGDLGGDVTLLIIWGVMAEEGKEALLAKQSVFKEPTGAKDYQALVAAMSKIVADLSREIASEIKAVAR
jgi:uncharacterized lipoprotein YmbA